MNRLIRIKKAIIRAVFYIVCPSLSVPKIINYEGYDWYLYEREHLSFTNKMAKYVGYLRPDGEDNIYLTEVGNYNRNTAYRQLYRTLLEANII